MIEAARLGFFPLLDAPFVLGLGVICGVCWLIYALLRGRSWLLRALALSFGFAAITNPMWVKENRDPLQNIVAVVIDRSESMTLGEREATANQIASSIQSELESSDATELRVVETLEGASGTHIQDAIDSALADAPRERIGGVIVITDGQAHDIPDADTIDTAIGPVHAIIVGETEEADRRVEVLSSPAYGIVGETVEITVQVDDPELVTAPLDLTVNGKSLPQRIVPVGEPQTISIDVARRGENIIVTEAPRSVNELTLANNRTAVIVNGVPDRLRVLLVTGEPHSGARVWRDLLKSDPSVDLVHFTILKPPHKIDATPIREQALISFPTRELFVDKLDEFDLVIFDRYRRINVLPMLYFDKVAKYVADGGALLVAGGPPYAQPYSIYRTPLAAILPARPTGRIVEQETFVKRSTTGERHTVTASMANDQDWSPWMRYVESRAKSGDTVLETESGSPLLVLDRVGDGRVAVLLSDQLWLWARGHQGGGPYAELVRRTAHWLMQEPELEEELLQLNAENGEITATLRTMTDTPLSLVLIAPDGERQVHSWEETSAGVFQTTIPSERLGLYAGSVGSTRAVTMNGPSNPKEFKDVRSTTDIMAPLAEATEGGVIRVQSNGAIPDIRRVGENGRAAGSNWIGLRDRNAYAVRSSQATPLLPGIVAALIFGLLAMWAWWREGR